MTDALCEAVANTFARWGSDKRPMFSPAEVGLMLSISLGLGALFDENAEAERQWMQSQHSALKTRPITAVLAGSLDEVLNLVNRERNL